jgi:hypothetical protein
MDEEEKALVEFVGKIVDELAGPTMSFRMAYNNAIGVNQEPQKGYAKSAQTRVVNASRKIKDILDKYAEAQQNIRKEAKVG